MTQLPIALPEQLKTIDESKQRIIMLLAATFLSYYTVDIQRQELVCTAADSALCGCLPATFPLRAASSIMVIAALLYFTRLSAQTLTQEDLPPRTRQKNEWNHLANILVLLAALIRFALLLEDEAPAAE